MATVGIVLLPASVMLHKLQYTITLKFAWNFPKSKNSIVKAGFCFPPPLSPSFYLEQYILSNNILQVNTDNDYY